MIGVAVGGSELHGSFAPLGLRHVCIEVLDPGLQRFFCRAAVAFNGQLLETALFDGCLIVIARGLGLITNRFVSFGIARLKIERGLLQAGKGIAVDTPGRDPAQLGACGLFQRDGGCEGLVVFNLFDGKRLGNRGQA
ncbi:hypothetical protein ALP64_203561 [Pseudomonas syringae pv. actinidiae]|nr:hypothetical protein ALP64_203561 [Pseudomonas syringae pv. actinidiae]